MTDPPRDFLILDACVLIDYFNTDPGILALVARNHGNVFVTSNVLAEVKKVSDAKVRSLGLQIVTPEIDLLVDAEERSRHGGLSVEDWTSLLLAEQYGWCCVTNEKRLRNECKRHKVPCIRGLRLLIDLVESGQLSKADAVNVAEKMSEQNLRLGKEVIQKFKDEIGAGEK